MINTKIYQLLFSDSIACQLLPSMYKMPFAVSKILGEIRFFYGDFGTDKEFVEDEILELGVTVLGC